MALTPEDRERIYEEEKARHEASERVKKEAAAARARQSGVGCLVVIAAIILAIVIFGSRTPSPPAQPAPRPTAQPSTATPAPPPETAVYARTTINIRGGPGTQFSIVGTAALGDRLVYERREGDWYKLAGTPEQPNRWVAASVVLTEAQQRLRDTAQVVLLDWVWRRAGGGMFVETQGQVRNVSGVNIRNVEVVVTFFAEDGRFITTDSALIDYNPILPGQTSAFTVITVYNPAMHTASIDLKEFLGGTLRWYRAD
jgi:hypothetical protein